MVLAGCNFRPSRRFTRSTCLAVICLAIAAQSPPASGEEVAKPKTAAPAKDGAAATDQAKEAPRGDTPVGRLLVQLETLRQQAGQDKSAQTLRDLIELGPDAVPELIVETDTTQNSFMLRCMGFVLRGIGDSRAVPALIRAIPRTLIPPGSDMGYRVEDKDLFEFMRSHDLDEKNRGDHYGFGRPVREISGALRKLTGTDQADEELYSIFLAGNPDQRRLKRNLFMKNARRWSYWWSKNWSKKVTDEKYSTVGLPFEFPSVRSEAAEKLFPRGAAVKMESASAGIVLGSVLAPKARFVFLDLDTGRFAAVPASLKAAEGKGERIDDILGWAAQEGFDLMGTEYEVPETGKTHYVIRSLGMTAWDIGSDREKTLQQELQNEGPLELGNPVGSLLAPFDEEQGRYNPLGSSAYLFITREGAKGTLFVGVEVLDTNVKLGSPLPPNIEMEPVGFEKGRRMRYSLIVENGDDPPAQ